MNVEIEVRGPLVLVQRDLGAFSVRGALVLVGDRHALVWDTLAAPSDMWALGAHLAGREVTVVYSHADWDHCWGTAGLDTTPPRAIVAHRSAADRFARELPATLADMRSSEPGRWDDVRLDAPGVLVEKGLTLDIGGLTVQLEHVPGHSPDSLVAWLPQLGVLLAGDVAEDPLPEVRQPEELATWAAALERWFREPGLRVVVPGHGAVGGAELLATNARYLRSLVGDPGQPGDMPQAHHAADRHSSEELATEQLPPYYRALHEANVVAVTRPVRAAGLKEAHDEQQGN